MKNQLEITQEMQAVVEQMRLDDIEENPDIINEVFDCDCCGKTQCMAGSVEYSKHYRLCNDCVLFAEIGFALKKFTSVQDLVDAMEDKRLEELCNFIKTDENRIKN